MANPSREIVLLHSQSISANGAGSAIVVPPDFVSVIIRANASGVATGTSPTLNFFIQQGFRDVGASDVTDGLGILAASPTVWDDYAALTQITAQSSQFLRIFAAGGQGVTQPTAASDAALTAGTVRNGPLGMWWRIKWTVGGTTPVFPATYVTAQFINQPS